MHFIEQFDENRFTEPPGAQELRLNLPADFEPWGNLTTSEQWAAPGQRWLFMSDVCKHCMNAPLPGGVPDGVDHPH